MNKRLEIGEKYNKLTVIGNSYKLTNTKFKRLMYLVRCDCGNELYVIGGYLRAYRIKSCPNCGFRDRELAKNYIPQIEQVFRRLVIDRCKKHNIEITINSKDYEKIGKENCYYCGNLPQETYRFKNRKYVNTEPLFLNGVDRLDPNKGYILENCVSCCTSCNYSKHILSELEFKKKIVKIYKNMNLKEEEFCELSS